MTTFKKEDFITGDKFLSLQTDGILYLKTDVILDEYSLIIWRRNPHFKNTAKIWITGHSDFEINEPLYNNNKKKM